MKTNSSALPLQRTGRIVLASHEDIFWTLSQSLFYQFAMKLD